MSYDLFFRSRSGASDADVLAFFRDRPKYTLEGNQAYYGNDDTGVYFGLEIGNGDQPGFPIALNINYCRPTYFILEAAPEVAAFVAALDLAVFDPQRAMLDEQFNPTTMIASWKKANVVATREIRASAERQDAFDLPSETLKRAWQWNLNRAQLQSTVGESKFVPLIMFASIEGRTVTSAVWPDGIPAVLPKVEHVCISRSVLAPRKFFRKEPDITFAAWDQIAPTLLRHGSTDKDGTITLNYDKAPEDIAKLIRKFPEEKRITFRVYPDRVLDREMVQSLST